MYTMKDALVSAFPQLNKVLVRKFPEHPKALNLQKHDKAGYERILSESGKLEEKLKPLYYCLVDVQLYYSAVLKLLREAKETVLAQNPRYTQNLVKSFTQTAIDAVRVQILMASIPRKLLIQHYALARHHIYTTSAMRGAEDPEIPPEHDDLVLFNSRFQSVIPCLQMDFQNLSDCFELGIKNVFGPIVAMWLDSDLLREEKAFNGKDGKYSIGSNPDSTQQQLSEAQRRQMRSRLRERNIIAIEGTIQSIYPHC